MHYKSVREPDRWSTVRGRFPKIERAFEIRLMIEDKLTIFGELRPISIAHAHAELARAAALGIHLPNVPIAASVRMKRNCLSSKEETGA